ncbi:MAG: hypothetical protein H0T62_02915 [Parachlamydiaceae bacterium]|nr:hypothetical protein [Parachlamydiaceae bacterium]
MWFQTVQNDDAEEEILKVILPSKGYRRLQHNFNGHLALSLDAHTPEVINALQEAGNKLVEDKAEDILDLCKILNPDIG